MILVQLRHAMSTQAWVPPTTFAWIYLGLGEIDTSFTWMDRAVDESDPTIASVKSYPFLAPLRADPRFATLLRKGLGEAIGNFRSAVKDIKG